MVDNIHSQIYTQHKMPVIEADLKQADKMNVRTWRQHSLLPKEMFNGVPQHCFRTPSFT